jgi:hypothetical protein
MELIQVIVLKRNAPVSQLKSRSLGNSIPQEVADFSKAQKAGGGRLL